MGKHGIFLPFAILALSFSTFCLNLSSVVVFTVMPVFLMTYFNMSCSSAGELEGVAEGCSLLTRAVTGLLSDFVGKRKRFLVIGYVLSLVSRLLIVFSGGAFFWVATSRIVDKVGNGVQASPREAFISDITPRSILGKAYGLNKTLGMVGSLLGSVGLLFLFNFYRVNLYNIFYFSTILVVISIFLLMFFVKDSNVSVLKGLDAPKLTLLERFKLILEDIRLFPSSYWKAIFVVFLFKMGYFSGAFLIGWMEEQHYQHFMGWEIGGRSDVISSIVMTVQNGFCMMLAYPMGVLADRIDKRWVVAIGFFCMFCAMIFLSVGHLSVGYMTMGIILYGIQMSMQGALMSFLSVTMPKELRGTGFGFFFLVSGLGVIVANKFLMKTLWDAFSPPTAFLSVCVPIVLALILLPYISVTENKPEVAKKK